MATVRIRARVTTTHPVAAYGGIQLSEDVVRDIAAAIASGDMPMLFNHDLSRPMHTSNVVAGVEPTEDGYLAAWAEFDVEQSAWEAFEAERDALGAPGGMSFAAASPIPDHEELEESDILIAADAAHFSDEEILVGERKLSALGKAHGSRYYQFAVIPDSKVVFDFTIAVLGGVSLNVLAAILYDTAKSFLKPRRATIFNLAVKQGRGGRRSLKLHLAADGPEALRVAMERAAEVLKSGAQGTYAYDPEGSTFKPLAAPMQPNRSTEEPDAGSTGQQTP
jgi:hypothetical protein